MRRLTGGVPHCKRCGCGLEGDEEGCPGCGFNPRQMGVRVSMGLLLVVVASMTAVMLVAPFWMELVPLLLWLAVVSFGLSVVTFVVSFLATPYRLGSVFAWF